MQACPHPARRGLRQDPAARASAACDAFSMVARLRARPMPEVVIAWLEAVVGGASAQTSSSTGRVARFACANNDLPSMRRVILCYDTDVPCVSTMTASAHAALTSAHPPRPRFGEGASHFPVSTETLERVAAA